MEAFK